MEGIAWREFFCKICNDHVDEQIALTDCHVDCPHCGTGYEIEFDGDDVVIIGLEDSK